jgi:hypothetical protein
MSELDETTKSKIAERARRPGGADTVCQKCAYWSATNWGRKQLEKDNSEHGGIWSDVFGFCKRRAPTPIPALLYQMAQLIGEIAIIQHEAHNYTLTENRDYDMDGRNVFEVHEWPLTNANDWCGEFTGR